MTFIYFVLENYFCRRGAKYFVGATSTETYRNLIACAKYALLYYNHSVVYAPKVLSLKTTD